MVDNSRRPGAKKKNFHSLYCSSRAYWSSTKWGESTWRQERKRRGEGGNWGPQGFETEPFKTTQFYKLGGHLRRWELVYPGLPSSLEFVIFVLKDCRQAFINEHAMNPVFNLFAAKKWHFPGPRYGLLHRHKNVSELCLVPLVIAKVVNS